MFLIIVIGLIGFGLYELVTTVYTVPNRQTKKSIKRLTQQKKLSEDLREFFVDPISKVILKFIKMVYWSNAFSYVKTMSYSFCYIFFTKSYSFFYVIS